MRWYFWKSPKIILPIL